jgi:acetylornithine deacetylase/succinyl-diaminopimelate desuccinylase-like protein
LEQCWRHPAGEFLEQSHCSRHVAVAEVNQRKVLGAEAPFRHDFDKAAVAHQFGLHHWRQIANAAARDKRGCEPGKIVHRQMRLKRQGLLIPAIDMNKGPAAFRPPIRKSDQSVRKELPRRLRPLAIPQIVGARDKLMAVGLETRPDGSRAIRARGASDDKGQVMTFIEACRAWKTVAGKLPVSTSILLEGEEESGGASLPPFLETHANELRADIGLICDTNMWDARTPAIQTMLRGLCGEELTIRAADRDLHSGFYGSAAANPNRILARILSDLHDSNGGVTIPGFYDGVPELPDALRAQWDTLHFDPAAFLGAVGLSIPAGEKGRSVLEMTWSRPTCEINGMGGGYQGAGFKTVIPSTASAKVSFRLVFDQDPHAIRVAFRDFVRKRIPPDCKVEFAEHGAGRAIRFPIEADAFAKTRDALTAEWGRPAVFIGGGGSIPVTAELKQKLGMDVVLAGFALEDDRIHSPNEKYELESFRRGARSWARVLHALEQQ